MVARNQLTSEDLEFLRARLNAAANLYASSELDLQRNAVVLALSSVADLLEDHGFDAGQLAPILRPVLAIYERENNNLDAMFSKRPRGGRPKSTLDELERYGILASLAEFWLSQHRNEARPQKLKLDELARKIRGEYFGNVTRTTLQTARELVSQEAKNHPAVVVARVFDELLNDALELNGDGGLGVGPNQAVRLVIEFVNGSDASRMKGIWKTPSVSPSGHS